MIPKGVRRKLRLGLGSRSSRRAGTKTRRQTVKKTVRPPRAKTVLAKKIQEWLKPS